MVADRIRPSGCLVLSYLLGRLFQLNVALPLTINPKSSDEVILVHSDRINTKLILKPNVCNSCSLDTCKWNTVKAASTTVSMILYYYLPQRQTHTHTHTNTHTDRFSYNSVSQTKSNSIKTSVWKACLNTPEQRQQPFKHPVILAVCFRELPV
jgi:hypothetical protein